MLSLIKWCEQNDRPDILQAYLDGKNPTPPQLVAFSSAKTVRWGCWICGMAWEASPNKMNRKDRSRPVCPYCSHERPSPFYNAAKLYPEMIPYWDTERNQGDLADYLPKSGTIAHWKCRQGHTWTRQIKEQAAAAERCRRDLSLRKGDLCPYCGGRRVSPRYNLEEIYREVANQWYYSKNGALVPRNVLPYSQKKVFWQCSFDPSHIWADRISNRTLLLRGCPICSRRFRISYAARSIYYYLHQNEIPCASEVPEGRYRIDIVIRSKREDQPPVDLEVDGYRHEFPDAAVRDARKTAFLQKNGYRVIRVKEVSGASEEIRVTGDEIVYPASAQNRYLDRVIQHILMLTAGVRIDPDHVRDHWKIEEFYYHTRREQSLAVQYPQLAEEWSTRNPDTPETVSPGSGARRWWKCSRCGKEYQAAVSNRTRRRSGCPYCAHQRVTPETCLAAVCPEVAAEWDEEKNGALKPTDVLPGANRRVWWRCGKGHSWQALIYTRTGERGTKCPFCQGRAVDASSSLAGKTPALARYWHPTKNPVPPEKVSPCSNQTYWWQCPAGHQWQDTPNLLQKYVPDRICPYCDHRRVSEAYCLAAQNRGLAAFWHPEKNAVGPEEVAPHSNRVFWWRCPQGHEWQEQVRQMQVFGAEKACPYCSDRRVWEGNCLERLAPGLAAQWHPTKNLPLTPEQVFAWSAKKVWWQCPAGHEWQTSTAKRYQRGDGCPYCSGHRASPDNCLAAVYPELISEWDKERNGSLTPGDVTAGSGKRIWWTCGTCGHSWQATVRGRIKSKGCPVCCRKQIRHGSFAQEHPELLAQWDGERNSRTPHQYAAHSNQKVWWRCEKGHSWQAAPDARSRGSGCPFCARERRKRPAGEPSDAGE